MHFFNQRWQKHKQTTCKVAVLLALLCPMALLAQPTALPVNEWVNKLAAGNDYNNQNLKDLEAALLPLDSNATFFFLQALEEKGSGEGNVFFARYYFAKAIQVYQKNLQALNSVKPDIKKFFAKALQNAYETGDEYLITFIGKNYGGHMFALGEYELAATYMLSSLEISERLFGHDDAPVYIGIGELFYRTREYDKSIAFTLKGLDLWQDTLAVWGNGLAMSPLNTVGLGYHRMGRYDSAFYYYRQAIEIAKSNGNEVWTGIISGNMGQIYYTKKQYDTAITLLDFDYRLSKQEGYFDNAANSLQWLARTHLALGNKQLALQQVREAMELLQKIPDANYLRNTLYATADIFKAIGNTDSALYYTERYNKLHDSLEKVISLSSISIAGMRSANEKYFYHLRSLQKEKKAQEQQRNFVVAGILLLAIIALLLVNKKRLQLKHGQELAKQQQWAAEKEVAAAREQLKMFTANILEKAALIEKLEQQANNTAQSSEQHQIMSELAAQTILTDDDWERFKVLYEKIYPQFFVKLRQQAPDIAPSELRMAAIIRLQLSTRETASMLGISIDSVHKTRQRLRQRLQLESHQQLDEVIGGI
jgi:tetratricopeptide (TPR) repeat protein/DNA-binding CsgD family transcriptional regulator